MIRTIFHIILLLLGSAISLDAQNVEVIIKGIKSEKGQIVIGIFKDQETFRTEEAFLSKSFPKANIVNKEMKIKMTLEPGTYGLSLLDDENMSSLMEYNFIGMPKEGFGFSDYYHTGITKPKFDDFKFTLYPGQNKTITIKIRYIM
ncbi:MAG: hypothetical protein A2Z69_00125 [Bacteroidetes bacterium RBG_13_44_24]|nr:MAG: hypothetical protein A2Z69_00125 [Bacteroidetes bacterium RBG_13_44_24]